MCYKPLHIQSPKISADTFIHGVDRQSLTVPCGHCAACIQNKIDQFVFRAYQEYLSTLRFGGFTIFQTFTYSEEHTPYNQGFRYFRKSDCQKMLKRLRINLERSGWNVDNGLLKYIITSEYGAKKGHTHRSHYHGLFFVNVRDDYGVPISPEVFDAYLTDAWSNLDKSTGDRVEIGKLDPKVVNQRIVNSVYGIRYVCKYVAKGTCVMDAIKSSYVRRSHINRFIYDFCLKENIDFNSLEDWQLPKIWKAYLCTYPDFPDDLQLMPFVLQSDGIGMDFVYRADLDELLLDTFQIKDYSPKGFHNYQLPIYYIRKVFYDYDSSDKRFKLNSIGVKYLEKKNDKILQDSIEFVNNHSEILNDLVREITKGKYCSLSSAVKSIINNRVDDFVLYSVYLRDKEINPVLSFLDLAHEDIATLARLQFEFDCDCYLHDSPNYIVKQFSTLWHDYVFKPVNYGDLHLYNDLPQVIGFDEMFDLMCKVKIRFNQAVSLSIGEKIQKEKSEKQALYELQQSDSYAIFY